jgi:hypothetical protein
VKKRLAILGLAAIFGSILATVSPAQACDSDELPPMAAGAAVFAGSTAVVGAGGEATCWSGGGTEWNMSGTATASCVGDVVTISNPLHSGAGGASSISFNKANQTVTTPNGTTGATGTFTGDCIGAFAFVTVT